MARNNLNPLGRQVRKTIERTGLTFVEFCEHASIPYEWLMALINAEVEPKYAARLRRVARRAGVSLDELFRVS